MFRPVAVLADSTAGTPGEKVARTKLIGIPTVIRWSSGDKQPPTTRRDETPGRQTGANVS
ncbi:uncharacterized protein N7477_002187 [Penicillium maclennaniae]|uniref:uncharacterized protein n=1 Tax=Penicillium maclennaniae TaxID=1343394 RepID=UPI0025413B3C|nr:uncharacterized protein N7477_002187 [Penicillium maclennaniae]KAJ5676554.1 hypothetical protein N7477_002187 [Penicillium maclennaniae]